MSTPVSEFLIWAHMALAHYDFVEPQVNFIRHNENITFQVIDRKRSASYLLRIHKPISVNYIGLRQQPVALEAELCWLAALHRDTAITVQQPVKNSTGDFVTMIRQGAASIPCTVLSWVEGENFLQDMTNAAEVVEALGGIVAQLHHHVRMWSIPSGFVRPTYGREFFEQQLSLLLPGLHAGIITAQDYAYIQDIIEMILVLINQIAINQESWGLIHADLHRDNFLVYQQEIRPIDFSLCGFGYLLFDFGCSLPSFKSELRQPFIAGYRKYGTLPEDYPRFVEAFCLIARIAAFVFMLPNKAHHEWLKERIPRFVANECQKFARQEAVFLI